MQLKEPALFPVSSLKHVIELVHNFVISENVCKIIIFSVRGPENTVYFLIQILLLLFCHIQRVWQLTWQIQTTGCSVCITNKVTKKNLSIFICIALIRGGSCVHSSKADGWEIFKPKFSPFPTPKIMAILTLFKDGVFSLLPSIPLTDLHLPLLLVHLPGQQNYSS